jgi:hypothetical protein
MARSVDKLLDDILAAIAVGDEIVRRGRRAFGRLWLTLVEDLPQLRVSIERYRAER